jgi:chromosome segregation ATPase
MAINLLIAFFVILAFVVGVSLLLSGFSSLPKGKTAPAGEFEKTQASLKAANDETEKLRAQSNTLAVQLEEMKGKLSWAEDNVKALEDTLNESSAAGAKLEQLEKDLTFLSQKADSQAREAIDVITRLAAETEVLKLQSSAAASAPTADPSEIAAMKDENQKLQIQLDGYASKVKDLETAVAAAQEAGAKYADVTKMNTQFVEENTVLKKSLSELEDKIKTAQVQAEQFKAEQAQAVVQLQNKINELGAAAATVVVAPVESEDLVRSSAQVGQLQEELQRVRLETEEKIVQANAALVKMNSEMETLNAQINDKDSRLKKLNEDLYSTREELSVSLRTVHELKQLPAASVVSSEVSESLILEKAELQKRLAELGAANQRLLDKEKILTYKLAQSRAQALNLERLCDELKEKGEQMTVVLK